MEMPYQLEVLWCRTFQSVLKIGNYFMGYRMPKYLEGPGKIKELGAFLKEKGINDVLVVTGAGMVRRGQVQPMLDGFDENGIRYTVEDFLADHPDVLQWLMENTKFNEFDWTSYIKQIVDFATNSVQSLITNLFGMIKALFSGIFNAVVALVFAVYCLIRKEILSRQARRLIYSFLPEKFCDQLVRVARLTNASFSNFISGQCLEAVILGAMFAVAMLIFRMPYIPLVSVLIAVTALVPIVGAFAGCILGAFFILVDNPIQAVWFVIMFLVLQQIEGNLIYPRVVGKSVGLPGMWVLLAVSIGGELMGVAGMLIMIPLCSVLYTLLREITAKRLDKRCIDNAKLMDQPSPVHNRLAENHKKTKKKKAFRKKSQEVKQIREERQSESE